MPSHRGEIAPRLLGGQAVYASAPFDSEVETRCVILDKEIVKR